MGKVVYANAGYNGTTLSDLLNVANGNCGSSQVNNFSGSTVKWRADSQFGGSWSIEVTNAATAAASVRFPFDASSYLLAFAGDFTCPTIPTSGQPWVTIATVRTSSAAVILVQIDTGGKIHTTVGGAEIGTATAPGGGTAPALVAGTKYRLEGTVSASSGSSTGTVAVRVFNYGESTTTNYITGHSSSSAATGTTAFTHMDWGIGSNANVYAFRYSNVQMVTGSASFIGPYTATTPGFDITYTISPSTSVNAGDTVTVTVSRVTGTGSGTSMTVDCDWGDGTSTPAQSNPSMTHVYNPSATTDFGIVVGATLT